MRLHIENWIDDNKYSENVCILFKDAITSYKSGAYRPSLLFSYLGFMTILKERIISSNKPNLFPQGQWDSIIKKILNEDTWEAAVFDATQQQGQFDQTTELRTKDPVFNLNDNIRIQIKYWKDRRNDCAHYKDNIIDTCHVESFWAFIESNLPKITIEGGVQSLLNKINKHFDPTLTPPNKDITLLVKEVESSVETKRLKEFWNLLLDDSQYYNDLSINKQNFANRSFEVNTDHVNQYLVEILKNNKEYLKDFLSNHPDKFLRLNFSDEEIRKFWNTILVRCDNMLGIYTTLLRNCLIPKTEIKEANALVLSKLKNYVIVPQDHQILIANGFFESFKECIINDPQFEQFLWVNDRASLISEMITSNPADVNIANRLCLVYSQSTNSNWLLERFDRELMPKQQIRDDYKQIILQNDILIPNKLKKYFA